MERKEILITVVGLLGTFLLPWPGGDEPAMAEGRETTNTVRAAACADAAEAGTAVLSDERGALRLAARSARDCVPTGPRTDRCVSLRCGV